MSAASSEHERKAKRVQDEFGAIYDLTAKVAEGGQGIVARTHIDNLLVKVCRWPNSDPRAVLWRRQVEAMQRLPVTDAGLPVILPKARIVKPRVGYLMELVEGLVPLEVLLSEAAEAIADGRGLQNFVATGGLGRRLRLLARLARVLARLHALALAHGDISPKNVFVSRSHDKSEVWLIDCDNLTYAVRESALQLYTPDYGAPELLRGDTGISTYTDVWSFAVIAFQLLTLLHPFKSGEMVDADADLEIAALRGELPWIDHPEDTRNASGNWGVPRDYALTPALANLFDRCFRLGALDIEKRPVMSEWAEALEAAAAQQVLCAAPQGCGSTFYWNRSLTCPFCDTKHVPEAALRLHHTVFVPIADLGEDAAPKDSWIATDHVAVVGAGPVPLHSAPPGSAAYLESAVVATIHLAGSDLLIDAGREKELHLQIQGSPSRVRLEGSMRIRKEGRIRALHVGALNVSHDVWRFKW